MSGAMDPNTSGRAGAQGRRAAVLPALVDVALLAALWIGAVLVVNPLGNFPLNDDWAYGMGVRGIVEHGSFRPCGWGGMTLISQAAWGALFCLPAGFSFTALRFSTLCLALVGVLGMYFLLRRLGASRGLARLGALVLGFNPIFFALSFTFMTDVPFTTLVVIALPLMFRALERDTNARLLGPTLIVVVCVLCRQLGLFLPLAFAVCFVARQGMTVRSIARGAVPLVAGLAAFLGYRWWAAAAGCLGHLDWSFHAALTGLLQADTARALVLRTAAVGLCLGLFTLPFALMLPLPDRTWTRRAVVLGVAAFLAFALLAPFRWLRHGDTMPVLRNVFAPNGIGPVTMPDVFELHLPHAAPLPASFWLPVTILSAVGGGILLAHLLLSAARLPRGRRIAAGEQSQVVVLFVLAGFAAYCVPICLVALYDRYVIGVLPLLLCGMALSANRLSGWVQRRRLAVAVCLLAPYVLFSVAATRDYLTWNRLRWEALRAVMRDERAGPSEIDGGIEFNGWYCYDANHPPPVGKDRPFVADDRYMVSLGPVAGYEVVREYPFYRWLPPQEARILLLRRLSAVGREKGGQGG
jgi:hypothetical protein